MLDSNPNQTQTSVENIYETQNGYYVSGSSDNSIQQPLIIIHY